MSARNEAADPFLIFALPRSRTAWLAAFLSYGPWRCHHEPAITMRSIADVENFFRVRQTGAAETGASLGWRLLEHHVPELRRVVIRRPVDEVVASMMKVDVGGVATYDEEVLRTAMQRGDRALAELSTRQDVLTVDFKDLDREDACAAIFEHCLPYKFSRAWWESLKDQNIQKDVRSVLLYYYTHRAAVESFKAACKMELWRLVKSGMITRGEHAVT